MKCQYPSVSIFIPTYNDQSDLSACIDSIRHLNYSRKRIEVMIWDNGSEDETAHMVRDHFEEMKGDNWLNLNLIEWERNEGSYVPYNLTLPYLSPDTQYILGLDADVELSPDALSVMLVAVQDESVAVVGARSVYFDDPGKTSHGAGFVNRWTALYSEKDARKQIECDYVIGCCWLLKRRVFERLGGFDPEYYINHWEVDYCLRAKQNGFRTVYEPLAIARHKIQMHGTVTPGRIYYVYRNKVLLVRKNHVFFRLPWAILLSLPLSMGKLLLLSFTRMRWIQTKAALKGLFDGIGGKTGPTFWQD